MAKNKTPLTPEELVAKKERKTEKRKIFGDTFLKSLAVLLAIVFVYSVVYVAFGQGMTVIQKVTATGVAGGTSAGTSTGSTTGSTDAPAANSGSTDAPAANSGSTDAPAANPGSTDAPAANAGANDAASVADAINKATAAAVNAKAGYDWERSCQVKDIDVGRITGFLNTLINGISPGDDLNSVVGGFLGNGDRKETIKKGETLATKQVPKDDGTMETYYHGENYTLKATQLKAEDIKNLQKNGDTYTFTLDDCENPDRNGNVAISRFTNDIVIREEVEKEIKGYTDAVSVPSLTAKYSQIKCSVTIKDGKLTELTYSFRGDASLDVKVAIATVTGTGNLTTTAKYSNFKY